MKPFTKSPLKSIVIAVSISALSLAGSAQAHSDFDYSIPAQLLLLNALVQPLHHDHHYKRGIRHHGKHARYQHSRYKRHDRGHYKPRRHSDSHGHYSGGKKLIKKRDRH